MASDDVAQRLLDIKEAISTAEKEEARIKGKLEQIMFQLKKEFGITSIGEAKQLEQKLNEEIIDLKEKIEKGLKEIEDELERR